MKTKPTKRRQISVILRASVYSCRALAAPCIILVEPRPGSRAVEAGANSVRVAFVPAEIRLIAAVLNDAHPRLRFTLPKMCRDQNRNYVPGGEKRPFLCVLDDGVVRIGVELANSSEHPVVELTGRPNSRVWREGAVTAWIPGWAEFRALVAEYSRP